MPQKPAHRADYHQRHKEHDDCKPKRVPNTEAEPIALAAQAEPAICQGQGTGRLNSRLNALASSSLDKPMTVARGLRVEHHE